ncbi:SCP-2 sterol transfer family protein [Cooperia oncophora]
MKTAAIVRNLAVSALKNRPCEQQLLAASTAFADGSFRPKNGKGSSKNQTDTGVWKNRRFTLAAADFAPMFTGKITPTNAFMSKKLKIKGDMTKALKLEGVLKKLNKSKL